jgi:tetratricopeptide (TPR) repeat protein
MDRSAALRPLDEAAGPIRELEEYRSDAELSSAIDAVAAAVDRALRLALRTDPAAPEDHRLSALSPDALPQEQVVQSLRARDVISLETAGSIHELGAAAGRARSGASRPGDADLAARAVTTLRADLAAGVAEPEPVATTVPPDRATPPPKVQGSGRWMAWLGAALALLFVLGLAWALAGGGDDDFDAGLAAFRAARWDSAAAAFERVLQERPVDVTTMLYLARSYRRQGRLAEAGDVLGEAIRVAPDDADARRELGRLYMDLGRPAEAIPQFERALEHDPDSAATWAGLIQALQAVGDPRADRLLDSAPPEVQRALRETGR